MAINFLVQEGTNLGTLGPLDTVITLLQNFGFFRVILPFLLVFSIIYAVLIKTEVLGKEGPGKSASIVVALVAAFLVIVYTPVVNALATILPQAAFLIIIVVLVLMVLGLFGVKMEKYTGEANYWLLALGVIIAGLFVIMIGVAVGPSVPALYMISQAFLGAIPITGEISADTVALLVGAIIILSIIIGVIYMVTKD
jgi:lysylphosphatidylglycerol synthetase-like protein (DUF2156 family)